MTISFLIALLAFLVILFLIWQAKGFSVSPRIKHRDVGQLRPVDIEAFRNLIDPEEREYLRRRLPPADFRRIQRERLRATIEYIACTAHNALVLADIGQAAAASADQSTGATAAKLVNDAIRLRIYALQVIPRLYLQIVVPRVGASPLRVAERYEQITRQAVLLQLQNRAGGIPASM